MTSVWRGIVFLGTLLLAGSFFLPPDFYNSPAARFSWSLDAVLPFAPSGESLLFLAVCAAIIYPYLWALVAAVTWFLPGAPGERLAWRSQAFCHLFGGGIIAALGIALLILRDTYTPEALQWILALVPPAFLIIFLALSNLLAPSRRQPVLTALGLIIFVPPQLVLGRLVILDGGDGWGFFLGAGGGIIGLIGCFGILAGKSQTGPARPAR